MLSDISGWGWAGIYLMGASLYLFFMALVWPAEYERVCGEKVITFVSWVRFYVGPVFWPIATALLLPFLGYKLGSLTRKRLLE